MLHLYDMLSSGNAYKVRLMLWQLGMPFARTEMDILNGATRTPDFLKVNPNGKIPTLVLETGEALPESNAILWYLAEGSRFAPGDRLGRAQALQWMFFEQYSHEPYIAVARFWLHFPGVLDDKRKAQLPDKQRGGYAALDVMERHLARHDFFAGGRYSVADIALYAYTHVAGEGGFDLKRYPKIGAWLERVRSQPGHVPITEEGSPR
ncbi:MAG: glutathione S-transferase family protein [Alphaproteobacteria bacterium]|nr:glutathione S-transferase family protein [Alphaproteobacteria bacterium]